MLCGDLSVILHVPSAVREAVFGKPSRVVSEEQEGAHLLRVGGRGGSRLPSVREDPQAEAGGSLRPRRDRVPLRPSEAAAEPRAERLEGEDSRDWHSVEPISGG